MKFPTVADLRKRGFKVKVTHIRRAVARSHEERLLTAGWEKNLAFTTRYQLLSNGGITVVDLFQPDHAENTPCFHGEAHCSNLDAYNRKTGVQIALGRALKEYGKAALAAPA